MLNKYDFLALPVVDVENCMVGIVTIDDAMDTAGLPLLGVVPEDPKVVLAANRGKPLILTGRRGAANACLNIAKRLEGHRAPIMRIR